MPLSARRNAGSHKGTVEGAAPLLQLPHMDAEVARKLARKRVRGLPELQALQPAERRDILQWAGLSDDQVRLYSIPQQLFQCSAMARRTRASCHWTGI